MDGIDVAGATAAMDAAGGVEHLIQHQDGYAGNVEPSQTPAPATEQGQQQPQPAVVPEQIQLVRDPVTGRWAKAPDQSQQQVQQTETQVPQQTDDGFTKLDPTNLPVEVQPFYKSMLADYTRKTQEIASLRKQYESFGDPQQVQQAVEVFQQLQDPTNWPEFHKELSEALQERGYTPQQANAIAAEEVATQTAQQPQGLEALANDPDLAPFKQYVDSLKGELEELKGTWQEQQEVAQQEQLQQAVIGELTRQENLIRQSNPNYSDDDIDAIYELSSFYDGNLIEAQQRYDQVFTQRLQQWMSAKQGAAQTAAPLPGAAAQSVQQTQEPRTLDEGHALAMERIRQLEQLNQ